MAAVPYRYPWPDLVHRFKFREDIGWAGHFAQLLRHTAGVQQMLSEADYVLPMPLSEQRLRARGFNQALLLAQALCPAKTRQGLLLRTRDTPAQSSLPTKDRSRNVRHAYAVPAATASALHGKSIVLVDDVMTSGASLREAAQALRHCDSGPVCALVFARAE